MTLSLGLTGINRALLRRGLVRYRNALVVIVASVLATALALALLAPAAAPDLAQPSHADRVLLLTDSWAKGDVIAVVRHGERSPSRFEIAVFMALNTVASTCSVNESSSIICGFDSKNTHISLE